MKVGRTLGRQGLGVSKVPRALLSAAIITGCSSLIGIDDAPPASECVRNQDCAVGFTCEDFRCVSSVGGEGGEAGAARAGTGGKGGSAGSGAAGSGTGGGGGAAGDDGGAGGTGPTLTGGKSGSGGRGGTAGHAGDEGGAGGEPPGEVGGAGAGGEAAVDECAGSLNCLACDEEGRGIPGETACDHACREDVGCVVPPSCNGLITTCGSNVSCCLSYPVYGGSFNRGCDDQCACEGPYPANVATFALDAFEVTVGRFRRFVSEYATAMPATGAGKNPKNVDDLGWRAEWNDLLPTTREAVIEQVTSPETCLEPRAYEQSDDRLPMNCVTWYLAHAFCIWDGGRLPTQAEWNYAARGGNEERTYPWSSPPDNSVIDGTYAVYGEADPAPESPAAVGTHREGRARWHQHDLSGNVAEWVFDDYGACYATPDRCDNCGISSAGDAQKTLMGGGFWGLTNEVTASARSGTSGVATDHDLGFRCARDL